MQHTAYNPSAQPPWHISTIVRLFFDQLQWQCLALLLHALFICRQQLTYQASAIAATAGVSALAIFATYYKFAHHMTTADQAFPWVDMAGTLALVVGGVVGMEMWARWAHKVLWHDFQPGWSLHKSHHEPRIGPFEVRSCKAGRG